MSRVKSAISPIIALPNRTRQRPTTISLGTNDNVCSLIEVAAWIMPRISPAASAGIRIGEAVSASTHKACWATPRK